MLEKFIAKIIGKIPTQEDIYRVYGDGQTPNTVAQVKNCRDAYLVFTIALGALFSAAFLFLTAIMLFQPPAISKAPNSELWPFLILYGFMATAGITLAWYGHRSYQTEIAEAQAAEQRRLAEAGCL